LLQAGPANTTDYEQQVLQLTVVDRQGTSATFVLPLPNQL